MGNDNRDRALEIFSRVKPWLLIAAAAALAYECMRAQVHANWAVAQGTLMGILFLLAVAGMDWWRHQEKRAIRPELAALHQALKYLLLAFAIGIFAVTIVTIGMDRWKYHIVAKSLGTGILFAGGVFALGMLLGFLFGFPPAPSATTLTSGCCGPRDHGVFFRVWCSVWVCVDPIRISCRLAPSRPRCGGVAASGTLAELLARNRASARGRDAGSPARPAQICT